MMARERKFSKNELFQYTKEILLSHGYEGFTFSILADRLDVARGTLYKYYQNKVELITDYILFELNQFLIKLKQINQYDTFDSQFEYLLTLMFTHSKIRHILITVNRLLGDENAHVKAKRKELRELHLEMYHHLQSFIQQGRQEGILKPSIPDELILSFILQSIEIPDQLALSQDEWVQSRKELLSYGMFQKK
ncbi:TetR/AcrR family transcriptional regulator [Lentibacillus sp. N15]|uniref:TetR/AcrR family transcriptional regulator n=1 Tax=Lentibacillus songyuanensis TaxID=3136161 RepID=UPI0031BA9DFE